MKSTTLIAALFMALAPACHATPSAQQAPANVAEDAAAVYTLKISERSDKIVAALGMKDEKHAAIVKGLLMDYYRSLSAWEETNEKQAKALEKASHQPDSAAATKAKEELASVMGSRRVIRDGFLAAISKLLSPEQVTELKDQLTYHKVRVTFKAYCAQNPWLNDADKEKIHAWLVEAREAAIEGGSADEKSHIFNKYKGRINNYLSQRKKEGR